ncbi:NUDIX domain-containing protein [Rhizobium sp. NRK18]|uniref:NUDIX domain-containing protein n=1 Tax=Rhizobium sp. NRK18 TaxID=2964667 RepID=UPI0021C2A422|nr:NUDIX domain-containing protein [Rhizobium sp. NRK18]MCQ2003574.1 NUDIX domain-containing protein [Rhizobium sp. NRK18]
MNPERTSRMRRIGEKVLLRALHVYYFLVRGMTLGVRGACFDEAGRIFLVRHTYVSGWHLPGGGVERDETAHAALTKELKEEGNLEMLEAPQLVQAYFNTVTTRRDHVLLYRVRVRQSAPRLPDREIAEAGFFALDGLPDGVTPATRRRLAELAGEISPAEHW